jgi:molecular chaperone DnaK (HSP70)
MSSLVGYRQANKGAVTIARVNVLGVTNEQSAAAITLGLNEKMQSEYEGLIFDLGRRTFDVSK